MDRSTRTLVVVAVAVVLASAATYLVYTTIKNRPAQVMQLEAFAVVAARPIPLGTRLTPEDVKTVPWPAANKVPGGFATLEEVVDHGAIAAIAENEPLSARNVASKEAGAGLPSTIPQGMRALSVKVNEVIGVAGFVVPGTRVDVMVILRDGASSMARVVVSNVQVLAAGTKIDQAIGREGQAIQGTSVVTLLVSPDDAALVALASNEGNLLLTLRNPLDTVPTSSTGLRASSLTTGTAVAVTPMPGPEALPRPRRAAAAPKPTPAPEPPPAPKPMSVEVIRAGKRTQEIIK